MLAGYRTRHHSTSISYTVFCVHTTMSRPQFFNAFRSAFSQRTVRSGAFSPFAFSRPAKAGPFGSRASSGVVSTSMRSTLFRPITMILVIAPLLTGYLGVWQVQRLKWKLALIDEVDTNLAKDPIVLPGQVKYVAQEMV